MYKVRENVTVSDFSKDTMDFLLKIGFKENDNMSEVFQNMLNKKGYNLNDVYTSKVKLCNLGDLNKSTKIRNDYDVMIYCHSIDNNNKDCSKNMRTIAKEGFNKFINCKKVNTYKLGEVCAS